MAGNQDLTQDTCEHLKDEGPRDNPQRRECLREYRILVEHRQCPVPKEAKAGNCGKSQNEPQFDGIFRDALQAVNADLESFAKSWKNALRDALVDEEQWDHQLISGTVQAYFRLRPF